jgi:hypothetical protein
MRGARGRDRDVPGGVVAVVVVVVAVTPTNLTRGWWSGAALQSDDVEEMCPRGCAD